MSRVWLKVCSSIALAIRSRTAWLSAQASWIFSMLRSNSLAVIPVSTTMATPATLDSHTTPD